MAEIMKSLLLSLALLSGLAHAADPTRPPEAWLNALGGNAEGPVLADQGRLQLVLLPARGGPAQAIIGGRTVRPGDRYGEDTVVHIRETDVLLRGPEGETRLYLAPQVEKTMIGPSPVRAGLNARKKETQ